MSKKGIKLSEKRGLNPTMLLCPICGEETNGIALLGKINKQDDEAPKHMFDRQPCPKCKKLLDEGNKFILECEDNPDPEHPHRTGRYVVIKGEAMPDALPIAFCEHTVFEKLIAIGKDKKN